MQTQINVLCVGQLPPQLAKLNHQHITCETNAKSYYAKKHETIIKKAFKKKKHETIIH